ncbi:hypothetical protein CC1G_04702 [Coprinopsis cinerea okayama7|uniref:Uncharacterized protein n=1 Tax=Coprinopsis cinerea (strain Okayama-7 / 130 / ATCC MYA-4618 / FGSC 9003) TaxID=240176 RepID=A8P278_COPC7|nr:hypothetical protein CC1G_04702 [Coprinopsis cinerea okayama7\|eukprot:XP_001838258.1 hypothetical protein CC1G_04702 [Coprinopsis cinerea okayama7\
MLPKSLLYVIVFGVLATHFASALVVPPRTGTQPNGSRRNPADIPSDEDSEGQEKRFLSGFGNRISYHSGHYKGRF